MNPHAVLRAARLIPARLRYGRPAVLAARLLAAVLPVEVTVHCGAGPAATTGTLAGIITWLTLTARGDLAPPGRSP